MIKSQIIKMYGILQCARILSLNYSLTKLRKEALICWNDGVVEREPTLNDTMDKATDGKPAQC